MLDLDHSEDAAHEQQALAFYNPFYQSQCYLPLMIFDGQMGRAGSWRTAPWQAANRCRERHDHASCADVDSPSVSRYTHILVRGDGHFSGPEMMAMIDAMPNTDFIFGLPGNKKLQVLAEPAKQRACQLWADVQTQDVVPDAVRLFDKFDYAAGSWSRTWRVLLKAEVMVLGENPRFVVTSLLGLDAGMLYEELYCARGQAENFIKHLKTDLAADRTSCTGFLANCMRLRLLHAAAYCMPPPTSCINNCAPRPCSIPRCRKHNPRRSSPN